MYRSITRPLRKSFLDRRKDWEEGRLTDEPVDVGMASKPQVNGSMAGFGIMQEVKLTFGSFPQLGSTHPLVPPILVSE